MESKQQASSGTFDLDWFLSERDYHSEQFKEHFYAIDRIELLLSTCGISPAEYQAKRGVRDVVPNWLRREVNEHADGFEYHATCLEMIEEGLEEFSRRKKLAQSPPRAQAKEHVIKTCPSAPRIKLIDLPEEC